MQKKTDSNQKQYIATDRKSQVKVILQAFVANMASASFWFLWHEVTQSKTTPLKRMTVCCRFTSQTTVSTQLYCWVKRGTHVSSTLSKGAISMTWRRTEHQTFCTKVQHPNQMAIDTGSKYYLKFAEQNIVQ